MLVSISMTLLACGSTNSVDTSSTKEDSSVQNFKNGTITINNCDYITDEYSMTNGTITIDLYQLCIVVDDISYIITLGSSPENIEANKEIISHFSGPRRCYI